MLWIFKVHFGSRNNMEESLIKKYEEFLSEIDQFNKQNGYMIKYEYATPTFTNFMFWLKHGYVEIQDYE